MLVYSYHGKCVEVRRESYYTDTQYYTAILKIKYDKSLETDTLTVSELCEMI